jgi:hypothetical protein
VAKTSGLGDSLFVNGYDLSGDAANVEGGVTIGEMNATGLNKSAMERLQLLADSTISMRTFFTGDTSDTNNEHAHERLRTLSNTALVTYLNGGTAGNFAAGHVCKQFSYAPARGENGDLFVSVDSKGSGGFGMDIGRILDSAAAPTAVGNGTVLDLGTHGWSSTAFHLHVTAFTGTDVTLLIQTDDNSGMTTPTTYGTFAVVSGRTYERLAVATAPERYIRWRASAGTFTAVSFAVTVHPTS